MFAGCIHSGVRYDHKAKWRPAESPCDVCHCLVGRILIVHLVLIFSYPVIFICLLSRRAVFTVRGSSAAHLVKTQLLHHQIPAVRSVRVGLIHTPEQCECVMDCRQTACAHVCLAGCGANGHDFLNGAAVPTGDRCQECTCVVRDWRKGLLTFACGHHRLYKDGRHNSTSSHYP